MSCAALCTAAMCENPAKYTRHAPSSAALMAAVRRCVREELAAAEWLLLMVVMAFPLETLGKSGPCAQIPADERQRFQRRPPTAGVSFANVAGRSPGSRGGVTALSVLRSHLPMPEHSGSDFLSLTVAGAAPDLLSDLSAPVSRFTP